MKTHILKTWPEFFQPMMDGIKPFDVRLNDREYKVGDRTRQREFVPCGKCKGTGNRHLIFYTRACDCGPDRGVYSGRYFEQEITFVLAGGQFGVEKGFCVLGLKDVK